MRLYARDQRHPDTHSTLPSLRCIWSFARRCLDYSLSDMDRTNLMASEFSMHYGLGNGAHADYPSAITFFPSSIYKRGIRGQATVGEVDHLVYRTWEDVGDFVVFPDVLGSSSISSEQGFSGYRGLYKSSTGPCSVYVTPRWSQVFPHL